MADGLRSSGIPPIGDVRWGSHICLFYETPQDLHDAVAAFFAAGLENREFCVWAVSEPVTAETAITALRHAVADFDSFLAADSIEIVSGPEWYLPDEKLDSQLVIARMADKLRDALARGYEGLRFSGNSFWGETSQWDQFAEYEFEVDRTLEDQRMIGLCTYSLMTSRGFDVLAVAHAHGFTIARRRGAWQLLEIPELRLAEEPIRRFDNALAIMSAPFRGKDLLTERERAVLAHVVKGASSKEIARDFGISPRTIDFHRANIMSKLGARNTADLIRMVLSQ